MSKNITLAILLFLFPFISFSQWTELGDEFNGNEGDKLGTTHSTDISGDGNTIAFGTPFDDSNGPFSGYAQVFQLEGDEWIQKGGDFVGSIELEGTGSAVSLSDDGNTVAIGSSHGLNSLGYRSGVVNVYDWDGSAWNLRGAVIEGEGNENPLFETDVFGTAIDISNDGNFIVVGARGNTPGVGVLQISGHVRAFQWNGSAWEQMGEDIDGLTGLEEFGYSVSINAAGNVIAAGGRSESTNGSDAGYVRVFEWNGVTWNQRGESFMGETISEKLGTSVSLSKTGNTVAMGATNFTPMGTGTTDIFDWNGTSWIQRGNQIVGPVLAQSGTSIDMSSDGNVIAIGEPWFNSAYGRVSVLSWDGSDWVLVDSVINPSNSVGNLNAFGNSVRLNNDGSKVIVGASANTEAGFQTGQIKIYENETLVSINEISINEISYFPNPTSDNLFIKSTKVIDQVKIYNFSGQLVKSTNHSGNELIMSIQDLIPGSYILEIQSYKDKQTVKIIKE